MSVNAFENVLDRVQQARSGEVANLRVLFSLLASAEPGLNTDEAKAVLVDLGTDAPVVQAALRYIEGQR